MFFVFFNFGKLVFMLSYWIIAAKGGGWHQVANESLSFLTAWILELPPHTVGKCVFAFSSVIWLLVTQSREIMEIRRYIRYFSQLWFDVAGCITRRF